MYSSIDNKGIQENPGELRNVSKKSEPLTLGQKINNVWQRANAIQIRNQCYLYGNAVFANGTKDLEQAFTSVLDKFYLSNGGWKYCREFPEIHDRLISVNVQVLRDGWNKRELDLRNAILVELRRAYAAYADRKGFDLYGISDGIIKQIWLINGQLVVEMPISVFPITSPVLAGILATDEYRQLINKLNGFSKF